MTRAPYSGNRHVPFFLKLVGALLLVVTLPVIGLSFYHYTVEQRSRTTEELTALQTISTRMAHDIDTYIVTNQNLIRHIALHAELKNFVLKSATDSAEPAAFNQWLHLQASIVPNFSALYVLDTTGTCIASTDPAFIGQNYAMRYYFRYAIAGSVYQSDWNIGLTSGEPGIYFSAPISDGTTTTGVVVLKMGVDRIIDIVDPGHYQYQERDAFLLNRAGIVLVHTRREYLYHGLTRLSPLEHASIQHGRQFADIPIKTLNLPRLKDAATQALQSRQPTIVHYAVHDQARLAALHRLHEQDWIVGVAIPEELMYARSHPILHNTLVFLACSLIISMLVALLISRMIARPLVRLRAQVTAFGAGQIDARAGVESNDEVGQLAVSFNQMADIIAQHTRLLEERVWERTRDLERLNEQLRYLSNHDPLTGCYNRRYLNQHLEPELVRSRQYGQSLALIMCDIDHFKRVNDTYGHLVGDAVLRDFGHLLHDSIRAHGDWVVRYGGEEFLLILPETDLQNATRLAEHIRMRLEAYPFCADAGQALHCTASFGVTALNGTSTDAGLGADQLTDQVDYLLYSAKHAGRNRVAAQAANERALAVAVPTSIETGVR